MAVSIFDAVRFFEAINVGTFTSFATEERFFVWNVRARDWFKKESDWNEQSYDAEFFPNYSLT